MINEDCVEDEEQDDLDDTSARHMSNRSSGVSKRMIEQFFTEVEGPDRDWQQYDNNMFEEEYHRSELILES